MPDDTAERPVVYGAAYSAYVRGVRLTLIEKGVPYDLVEVDVFGNPADRAAQLARHPFGKIPAFEHAGFRLYESQAIERYVDEAFDGPRLQSADLRCRTRMNQVLGLLDAYVYSILVWEVHTERVEKPRRGIAADEAKIAAGLAKSETCLRALDSIMQEGPWLAGPSLTLADLHAAPMLDYFRLAPEGRAMLDRFPRIAAWFASMSDRLDAVRPPAPAQT
jgi:glutathione S-transferase